MSLSSIFGYGVIIVAAVCLDVAVLRWRRRNLSIEQPRRTGPPARQWFENASRQVTDFVASRRAKMQPHSNPPAGAAPAPSPPAAPVPVQTNRKPVPAHASPQSAAAAPLVSAAAASGEAALAIVRVANQPDATVAPQSAATIQPDDPIASQSANGLARVNVSVELPVGATIRLTIETSAGVEPRVTVESPQRQWVPSSAQALVSPLAPLGLNPAAEPLPIPVDSGEPTFERVVGPLAEPRAEFAVEASAEPEAASGPLVADTVTGTAESLAELAGEISTEPENNLPVPPASLAETAPVLEPKPKPWTALQQKFSAPVAETGTVQPGGEFGLNWEWRERLATAWRVATDFRDQPLTMVLFGLSIVVYLLTRFIGLDRFPIYFFTDEAVQTLQAATLVAHGFRDPFGNLLPTYFQNGVYYNLSISVYAQVLPYLVFGKSIWVTRGTPALLSLLAPLSACLALKMIFKLRWWWLGALLLVITPAWFLHSRTGFETVLMVAFYGCFLYCYLLYRYRSPHYLYPALFFGALAFYSYNGGQFTVVVTGFLLLISDFGYHWQNRQTGWRGLALLGVLILPYVRFTLQHPGAASSQLRTLDSYWVNGNLTLSQKLAEFFAEYTFGLSPQFWLAANNGRDLIRHVMKGYGHLLAVTMPFLLVGLYVCIRKFREPAYRVVWIALLAAPVSGAITSVGITRVLVFVLPVALVTAIGLETVWNWLPGRQRWTTAAAVGIFGVMSVFGFAMLRDALVNGPVWYSDYELGGMQWGARQLFGEQIPAWLARDPQVQLYVSPSWANGTELFPQFFLTDQQLARVQLQGVAYYLAQKQALPPDLVVVLPPEEYSQVDNNLKFNTPVVEQILSYPNGQPGFYFLRLAYSAQADSIFAAEHAALLRPITETFSLNGQDVVVTHPRFGAGQLSDMLDGDAFTLVNAPGFNPFALDFAFPAPRAMSGLTLITGSMPDFTVKISVYADANATPQVYTQHYVGLPPDPTMKIDFSNGPASATRVQLEILDNVNNGPGVNIHIRDVDFR